MKADRMGREKRDYKQVKEAGTETKADRQDEDRYMRIAGGMHMKADRIGINKTEEITGLQAGKGSRGEGKHRTVEDKYM